MEEFARIKRLLGSFGFGVTRKHASVHSALAFAENSGGALSPIF
jgi:hypothetical protein